MTGKKPKCAGQLLPCGNGREPACRRASLQLPGTQGRSAVVAAHPATRADSSVCLLLRPLAPLRLEPLLPSSLSSLQLGSGPHSVRCLHSSRLDDASEGPGLRRHPSAVSGPAGQWPCTGSLGTELPPRPCHPPAESAVVPLSPRAPEPSHGSSERPGNGRRCPAVRSPRPARPPAPGARPGETFLCEGRAFLPVAACMEPPCAVSLSRRGRGSVRRRGGFSGPVVCSPL